MALYDLANMNCATVGAGSLTLSGAVSGYISFTAAGIADGTIVTYAIADNIVAGIAGAREIGRGTVGGSGTTLTRTVLKSTNANAALVLSGSSQVFITAAAEDFVQSPSIALSTTDQANARTNILAAPIDAMAYLNLAINPFHTVSQQFGSLLQAPIGGYLTDQNYFSSSGPILSGQQVANPFPSYPAIPYGVKYIVTTAKGSLAAGDYIQALQFFEGQRMAKLGFGTSQAQPVVIGQMMRSSINLTGYVAVTNGSSARTYIKQFTLVANTDTWITVIVPGDTAGTWPVDTTKWGSIVFCFGTGATYQTTANSWQAGLFLGASDTTNLGATLNNQVICSGLVVLPLVTSALADVPGVNDILRFQRHPDDELRYCQRYFLKKGGEATYQRFGTGYASSTTNLYVYDRLPAPMRIVPTVSISAAADFIAAGAANATLTSIILDNSATESVNYFGVTSGLVAGQAYDIAANGTLSARIYLNARM